MATIQQLATEANGFLYRSENTNSILKKDGTPEWVEELYKSAHQSLVGLMFPDDWRYEFIEDALSAFSDTDDVEDVQPDVDNLYPYTADRLRWLSSRLDRMAYCDEAMEQLAGKFESTDKLIALGMWYEMHEVFDIVHQSLTERMEADVVG